jgi:aspartate aminotransferase
MYRYTPVPGKPELLDAVAGYFARFCGAEADRSSVIATNGGKQALYNLFQVLLDPGDEVLIPGPYWVSYPDMVYLADGDPIIISAHPEQNFLIDPDMLEQHTTDNTKVLVLNTPSNPTGCHYSQEQLDAILDWAVKRDIFVISDEIYDQLVYPPAERSTAAGWVARAPGRVAVVNGLSKCFGLTGWRIGYVFTDPDLIRQLGKIQGQSTSNICAIAQNAALSALNGSWDFLEEKRSSLASRRDKGLEVIGSWRGVVCPKPEGAFYLFPRMDGFYTSDIPDSTAMCTYLLDSAGVALVPGIAFGDDRCLRFSYALDEETLLQALHRIQEALDRL